MALETPPAGHAGRATPAMTLLVAAASFAVALVLLLVVLAFLGGVGPLELVLAVVAAALVGWFAARRARAA